MAHKNSLMELESYRKRTAASTMAEVNDYFDKSKSQTYYKSFQETFFGCLYYYNVKLAITIRNKVILDLPCGEGQYICKYFKDGAKKVIGADLVELQVNTARDKNKEVGIPAELVELYVHDAKQPKQLTETLADVGCCLHLFCFANNYDELVTMSYTLSKNLKQGGECVVISCSAGNDENEYRAAIESQGEELIFMGPKPLNLLKPQMLHTMYKGFSFKRCIWPYNTVCQALREGGFSHTTVIPMVCPPGWTSVEYQAYIIKSNWKMIIAKKD